jgi:hypothetical protein
MSYDNNPGLPIIPLGFSERIPVFYPTFEVASYTTVLTVEITVIVCPIILLFARTAESTFPASALLILLAKP